MESSFSESACDFNDHTALMKESKDSSQQASTVKDLRKMLPDTCRVTLLKGAQWARSFSHLSSCSIVLSVTHCSSFSDLNLISSFTLLHCCIVSSSLFFRRVVLHQTRKPSLVVTQPVLRMICVAQWSFFGDRLFQVWLITWSLFGPFNFKFYLFPFIFLFFLKAYA